MWKTTFEGFLLGCVAYGYNPPEKKILVLSLGIAKPNCW